MNKRIVLFLGLLMFLITSSQLIDIEHLTESKSDSTKEDILISTNNEIENVDENPSVEKFNSSKYVGTNQKTDSETLDSYKITNKDISHTKKLYEDNWCDAKQQLSKEDYQRFKDEYLEWMQARGSMSIRQNNDYDSLHLNNEFIAPYEEMDVDVLFALAENDDKYALSTLLQRTDVEMSLQDKFANQLAVLGETTESYSHLAIRELSRAKIEYENVNRVSEKIKSHLLYALAWVELGFERKNPSAFIAFSSVLSENDNPLNPDKILSDDELQKTDAIKELFKNYINENREKKNLQPLSSIEIPAIADKVMRQELAIIYGSFDGDINGSRIANRIKQTYIADSECFDTLVARF